MAKAMLALAMIAGAAGCSQPAPAPRSGSAASPQPAAESEPTVASTTTVTEPPTTTTEPEEEPTTTVPTTRARSAPTTVPYVAPTTVYEAPSPQSRTVGGDGGWVIPSYIVACETGGTFRWDSENASGAAGPYQLMPEHFGGESALNQSRAAQHAKAAELWNGGVNTRSGLGPQNWSECL